MRAPILYVGQPDGSLLCGQACLAMLFGEGLEQVEARVGSQPIGDYAMTTLYGGRIRPREAGDPPAGRVAVCLTKASGRERGHWVVWDGERFLDPASGPAHELDDGWSVEFFSLVDL